MRPFLSHPSATLYVNLEEAGLLLGFQFADSATAAAALLEDGLARAVVTNSAKPATVASQSETISQTPPAVTVKRITGAGDTFMAAHIAAEAKDAAPDAALDAALQACATYISGDTY